MTDSRFSIRSDYMEWAKLHSHTRFNLATSGLSSYPLSKLPVRLEELEITGDGGYGYEPLQERLARRYGVPPERVFAATGTSMANHLALAALVNPGDEVLIEQPTYALLTDVAKYLGASIRRFPRLAQSGFQVDPRDVEHAITSRTRAVVLTNLHNPSGVRLEDDTLMEIGEIAAKQGAVVVVDEVYLEACFERPAHSSFHLGPNFVVTSSLTKVYGLSGLRCGWVVASPELTKRMWLLNDLFGATAAHMAERLSVVALDHFPEIAAHARGQIERNRALLDQFLDGRNEIETVRPEAGTMVFPRLLRGDVESFCRILRERYETSVVPGRFFEMPDHFRIGIGADTAMVEEGLKRLALALDEFR